MAGFSNDTVFGQTGLQIGDFADVGVIAKGRFQFEESGADVTVLINNTSDTASSQGRLIIEVGGSSAGDPFLTYTVNGVQSFSLGIDNSASDAFVLADGTDLSTNPRLTMQPEGNVVLDIGSSVVAFGALDVRANIDNQREIRIFNSSDTSEADASFTATVGGESGGDAQSKWSIVGTDIYTAGLRNSAGNEWRLTNVNGLDSGVIMQSTLVGEVTFPLTPCFLAKVEDSSAAVTGDGSIHTILFDPEIFDQNSDYNPATGTFTAPVTGRYTFQTGVDMRDISAAMTSGSYTLVTSNRNVRLEFNNPGAMRDVGNDLEFNGACTVDMDAADTATVTIALSNGALAARVRGNGAVANADSFFSGELAA